MAMSSEQAILHGEVERKQTIEMHIVTYVPMRGSKLRHTLLSGLSKYLRVKYFIISGTPVVDSKGKFENIHLQRPFPHIEPTLSCTH
jgi:hypothetical protein